MFANGNYENYSASNYDIKKVAEKFAKSESDSSNSDSDKDKE